MVSQQAGSRRPDHGVPTGRAARRGGTFDLLTKLSDDVTTVQDRYPRVLVPAWSAGLAGFVAVLIAAVLLPAAGLVLFTGRVVRAIAVPRSSVALASWADRRLAAGRAELSSRIVETLDGVEELAVLAHSRTGWTPPGGLPAGWPERSPDWPGCTAPRALSVSSFSASPSRRHWWWQLRRCAPAA